MQHNGFFFATKRSVHGPDVFEMFEKLKFRACNIHRFYGNNITETWVLLFKFEFSESRRHSCRPLPFALGNQLRYIIFTPFPKMLTLKMRLVMHTKRITIKDGVRLL